MSKIPFSLTPRGHTNWDLHGKWTEEEFRKNGANVFSVASATSWLEERFQPAATAARVEIDAFAATLRTTKAAHDVCDELKLRHYEGDKLRDLQLCIANAIFDRLFPAKVFNAKPRVTYDAMHATLTRRLGLTDEEADSALDDHLSQF